MATTTTCPGCGTRLRIEETDRGALVCPRCLTDLEPLDVVPAHSAGRSPWFYLRLVYFGILILTVLCIVGIVGSLHLSSPGQQSHIDPLAGILLLTLPFAVLDVLVIIPVGVLAFRPALRPGIGDFRRAFRILLAIAVTLLVLAAVVVFFFFTCGYMVGGIK